MIALALQFIGTFALCFGLGAVIVATLRNLLEKRERP